MKSIRLSLTVYFLLLLAVALGAASLLVYRTTQSSLQAREQATESLLRAKKDTAAQFLQARYAEDVKAKHDRLDGDLLAQARELAGLVRFPPDGRFRARPYNFLGALGAASTPNGSLLVPLWVAEGSPRKWEPNKRGARGGKERDAPSGRGAREDRKTNGSSTSLPPKKGRGRGPGFAWPLPSFSDELYSRIFSLNPLKAEIRLTSADLAEHLNEEVAQFFQINSAWGSVYYSPKMDGRSFDFDPAVFKTVGIQQGVDTTRLGPNLEVRRATYKAPAARHVPFVWTRARPDQWIQPAIYIQCACSTSRLDAAVVALGSTLKGELADLDRRLTDDLDRVRSETEKSLTSLRWHLLAVSLCTFAAAVIGTLVLVRLGLAPLHRLSEAVSRVSEKDFRLQYGNHLPRELSPIAERLNHTLEQLKRAFAREKQATADISHELRTPLAALLTTIDVTLRKPRSAEEYKDALEDCRASGQQINQAVERLLALARLDAGVDALRRQQVDACALAQQCVAVVRPLAEARGLSVSVKGDGPAQLHTDPDKLREVLNNLLHNAIEYNKPNGKIDVAVGRQNGHLCLEVQDTGIGIPQAARPHIFERFFRADPSRQADGLHAGLGLAIVKGYLELMGGTIDVNSTEGQGSTFSVRLPA